MTLLDSRTFFHGYVDIISATQISGWATDDRSDRPVALSIFINGETIARINCNDIRQDAVDAGFRHGRAFYFNPIRSLSNGSNAIEIQFEATGSTVPNGKREITYERDKHIGDHWSAMYKDTHSYIIRWWQYEKIVRHINKKVCGLPVSGLSHGLYRKFQARFSDRLPLATAVSVGCGEAVKEIDFVRMNLVRSFDLYELSKYAIEHGREHIRNAGLADRMIYYERDAFQVAGLENKYDVVFWNNSLHHMFDVGSAVEWSARVLRRGGIFVMDDFVGPSQMQWSDRLLEINTAVRQRLPTKYLKDPRDPSRQLPVKMERPNLDDFCAIDPSECADSGRILECLRKHFPNVEVILTGGGVYHLALNDVLHNLIEADDQLAIDAILAADDKCIEMGETHYAVALAVKE